MLNEIIATYAITDDLLKAIGHDEDSRRVVSDAEIITTAVCAAMFFNGNHSKACTYMKEHGLIPNMLDKSRFNRRLHGIFMLMKSKTRRNVSAQGIPSGNFKNCSNHSYLLKP